MKPLPIAILALLLVQLAVAQPVLPKAAPHCFDSTQSGNEQGVDCGGDCLPCAEGVQAAQEAASGSMLVSPVAAVIEILLLLVILFLLFRFMERARRATHR